MGNIRPTSNHLRTSEQGMVALMTTMVLMIVISLIVLGFAQLARRNQREALDRQLSTQAFYAAEAGVNDARKLINDAAATGSTIAKKDTCAGSGAGGFYASLNPDINATANVKYSCLLVDPEPDDLRYNLSTTAVVAPIISANGDTISRIEMDWQPKEVGGNPLTGCPTTTSNVFTPTGSWACGYGVLRFDLVPTAGAKTATELQADTMTSFVIPSATSATTSIGYQRGSANPNVRVATRCTTSSCSLAITGLSTNNYHMRISSLYREVSLQIRAKNSAGTNLDLKDAQAVVDVTGRAQDVLRRIQVHIPLRASSRSNMPDFALQTTDPICKRFTVMDGYFDTDVTGVSSSNRLCQP